MNGDRGMRGSFGLRLTRDSPWQRLVFGLILLGVGVVFWLDQIGTIDGQECSGHALLQGARHGGDVTEQRSGYSSGLPKK